MSNSIVAPHVINSQPIDGGRTLESSSNIGPPQANAVPPANQGDNSQAPVGNAAPAIAPESSSSATAKQKSNVDRLNKATNKLVDDISKGASKEQIFKDHLAVKREEKGSTHLFSKADAKSMKEQASSLILSAHIAKDLKDGKKPDNKHIEAAVRHAYHHHALRNGHAPDSANYPRFAAELTKDLQAQGVSQEEANKIVDGAKPNSSKGPRQPHGGWRM
jgi:hypothetical protein